VQKAMAHVYEEAAYGTNSQARLASVARDLFGLTAVTGKPFQRFKAGAGRGPWNSAAGMQSRQGGSYGRGGGSYGRGGSVVKWPCTICGEWHMYFNCPRRNQGGGGGSGGAPGRGRGQM